MDEKEYEHCINDTYGNFTPTVCPFNEAELRILDNGVKILVLHNFSGNAAPARGPLRFTNLLTLWIVQIRLYAPKDFFSLLHNLNELVLEDVTYGSETPPDLPPSLTALSVKTTDLETPLDLSQLYNLEILHYTNCALTGIPPLSNTAPLKLLDLSNNSLTILPLPDIAQYCQLQKVDFSYTNIQKGSNEAYCEFAAWFENHNVSYTIGNLDGHLITKNSSECSETIPQNMNAEARYNHCLNKKSQNFTTFVIVIALTLLAVVGLIYFFGLRRDRNDSSWKSSEYFSTENSNHELEAEQYEEMEADDK